MTIIDKLLEKYWAGDTSLAEEMELRKYFSGTEISEQHRPFAELFAYPAATEHATLPDDFDEALMAEINGQGIEGKMVKFSRYRNWLSVAAAVLFLMTAGIFFTKSPTSNNELADIPHLIINGEIYYPATEAEAYELTRQALLLVSSKMTKEPKKTIQSIKNIDQVNPGRWGKK